MIQDVVFICVVIVVGLCAYLLASEKTVKTVVHVFKRED